jgi:hypothetical protein
VELSVTEIENVAGPAAVGVPVMSPFKVLRLRPAGRDPPLSDQV